MTKSRWLALQAAVLVLGASVVPGVRAGGICPWGAQMQFQMQTRMMPPQRAIFRHAAVHSRRSSGPRLAAV